jgi:predicted nucleic acid-binding protein
VAVDPSLVLRAIAVSRRHKISFWDALVVATAKAADCRTVLSEDLGHGSEIAGVTIENPFLRSPA